MASDIFISYSHKDSEHALKLAEKLRTQGMTVWIDRHSLEAADQWTKEIVDAVENCAAFLLLLSSGSLSSKNVVRELSIASESGRTIVPLEIEPIKLPSEFKYQLAGIQRVALSDFEALLRSLMKLGIVSSTLSPNNKLLEPKINNPRKSLIVLPFEDISPAGEDNAWFADGLAGEMIDALGHIKSLRILDRKTSMGLRGTNLRTVEIGKEFQTRYFIEGFVSKYGEKIKISFSLLDIETGDYLWQESIKGVMNDIFDIQEAVALKVVEGLKVHLAPDEKKKLAERGTENVEAYELALKASEYLNRQTKEGYQLAIQLLTEAVKHDTGYAQAYQVKASALVALYRDYDRTPAILDEAETLCKEALRLNIDLFSAYQPLSEIYMHRGQLAQAEEAAREYIRKDPQNYNSHFTVGFFYSITGQYAKAIMPFEEAIRLKPDNLVSLFNLVLTCDSAEEREKCAHWAQVALPHIERHLMFHPDDEGMRVWYALLLFYGGGTEDAHAALLKLTNLKDSGSIYNSACLFGKLGDKSEALRTFRKAIEAGFRDIRLMKEFLTDDKDGVLALQGTLEWQEVKEIVDALEFTP